MDDLLITDSSVKKLTVNTLFERYMATKNIKAVSYTHLDVYKRQAMKRAERSAVVKGMDVVYIYHDTIDEASHTSDIAVFAACDKMCIRDRLKS